MNYTKALHVILIAGLLILLISGWTYAVFIGFVLVYFIAILEDILGNKLTTKKFLIKTIFLIIGLLLLYFVLSFI